MPLQPRPPRQWRLPGRVPPGPEPSTSSTAGSLPDETSVKTPPTSPPTPATVHSPGPAPSKSSTAASVHEEPSIKTPPAPPPTRATVHKPIPSSGKYSPPLSSYTSPSSPPSPHVLLQLSPQNLSFPALISLMITRSDDAKKHFKYRHCFFSKPTKNIPEILSMDPSKYVIPRPRTSKQRSINDPKFQFETILSHTAYDEGNAADFVFARMVELTNAGKYLPDAVQAIKQELKQRESWDDQDGLENSGYCDHPGHQNQLDHSDHSDNANHSNHSDEEYPAAVNEDIVTSADFISSIPSNSYFQYKKECLEYDFWCVKTFVKEKAEQGRNFVQPGADAVMGGLKRVKSGGMLFWHTLQSNSIIRQMLQHMFPWILFILLCVALTIGIVATVLWGAGFVLGMAENQFPQVGRATRLALGLLNGLFDLIGWIDRKTLLGVGGWFWNHTAVPVSHFSSSSAGWLKACFVSTTPMDRSIGLPQIEASKFTTTISTLTLDLYRNMLSLRPLSALLKSSLDSLQQASNIRQDTDFPNSIRLSWAFSELQNSTRNLAFRGSRYEQNMNMLMTTFESNVESVIWSLDELEKSVKSYKPHEPYFAFLSVCFLFMLLSIGIFFWRACKKPVFYVFVVLPILFAAYWSQCLASRPLYNGYGCRTYIDIAHFEFGYKPVASHHHTIFHHAKATSTRLHMFYNSLSGDLLGISNNLEEGHSLCEATFAAFSRVYNETAEVENEVAEQILEVDRELSKDSIELWFWSLFGLSQSKRARIEEAYKWRAHGPRIQIFKEVLKKAELEFDSGMDLMGGWQELLSGGLEGLKWFDGVLFGDTRGVWEEHVQRIKTKNRGNCNQDQILEAAGLIREELSSERARGVVLEVAKEMKVLIGRFKGISKKYHEGKERLAKEGEAKAEQARTMGLDGWGKGSTGTTSIEKPAGEEK